MVWNNSHQQSSKEHMKTSVKTQETHLESKKNEELQKFQQRENLKKKKMEMERRNGKRKKWAETYPFFSHLIGLYKARKSKVKINFDFGEKLHKCPPTSPNYQN